MILENILKDLMTLKCKSVRQQGTPCYKTGKCDGHCAYFVKTCQEIEDLQSHLTYCENNYGVITL